jgi:hypothetical protein
MINEIIGKHERTLENIKHVFYSNCANNTLFISFAGKVDKYVSVTWFYNQFDFLGNFLFLKNDEDYNTYQDNNYEKLINHYMTSLKITNLITYGPSMGGIASITYGLKFNANIIISIDPNPINFDYRILLEQIRNYDNNYDFKNKIYLNYTFLNDFDTLPSWTEEIISELKKKNIVTTLQPFRSIDHLFFIPSKEYLLDIIKAQSLLKVKNYSNPVKWF